MKPQIQRAVSWMAMSLPIALPFYLVRFSVGPLPTTLLEVHVLVMLGLALVGFGFSGVKEAWNMFRPWVWPAGLFLVASLAAVFWSPILVAGFGLWRAYILEPLAVFFFLPLLITKPEQRKFLERSMALVVLGVGVWAMGQAFGALPIPSPWDVEGHRATGPFPYPNALALFVVPIGAFLFSRWIESKREWWLLASWAMAGLSALFAKSDGGMLALIVATWFVLVARKETRQLAIIIAVLGTVFISAVAPLRGAFLEQATFSGWSGRVRTWMWTETVNMLRDTSTPLGAGRPILGAGFGGYSVVFEPYHEKTFIEIFQYPHNIVLNFWSETGLVGLLAFGWIVVTWVRKRISWIAMAPLVAILVHGLVDVPYFKNDLAMAFWLLVFLTTIQLDHARENR